MKVDRANFDDLTRSLVAPIGRRTASRVRSCARAARRSTRRRSRFWTAARRATRKVQDRRASAEFPEAKRLLGALANSRGHRHEENAAKLVNAALNQSREVGAALLASAEGYTPRANQLIDAARERLGTIQEVANALADNLPAPKAAGSRTRRRRRKRKKKGQAQGQGQQKQSRNGPKPAADKPERKTAPAAEA